MTREVHGEAKVHFTEPGHPEKAQAAKEWAQEVGGRGRLAVCCCRQTARKEDARPPLPLLSAPLPPTRNPSNLGTWQVREDERQGHQHGHHEAATAAHKKKGKNGGEAHNAGEELRWVEQGGAGLRRARCMQFPARRWADEASPPHRHPAALERREQ